MGISGALAAKLHYLFESSTLYIDIGDWGNGEVRLMIVADNSGESHSDGFQSGYEWRYGAQQGRKEALHES